MELIICTEQVNIMGGIDMTDNVNKPSHYQGSKGLESIEVIDNFYWQLARQGCMVLGECYQVSTAIPEEKRSRRPKES